RCWGLLLFILSLHVLKCSGWHVPAFHGLVARHNKFARLSSTLRAISSNQQAIESEPTVKKERVCISSGLSCFGYDKTAEIVLVLRVNACDAAHTKSIDSR